ncbi:MAG: type II toxin-antitoxin system VapC family toxin [Chloroflexi bacterium]|nr:type II toxin-antitoxin system VapC family toxin [Chloroflexota bacterium]
MEVVLDASALLASLRGEPGGEKVDPLLGRAAMSSVNWAEVVQRGLSRGVAVDGLRKDLQALGLTLFPFTVEEAEAAASLWATTRSLGLSLGDRACLALALRLGVPAVTANQRWAALQVGVRIQLVR